MGIKQVAEVAGVSIATVSHVINNGRYVAEPTRLRVMRAIKQLNYYPNAQARSLVMGRSTTLGLVVSDIANPFQAELVKQIEMEAFKRGYDVVLANTAYDPERMALYVRRFIERKLAGVLLMTSEMSIELISELNNQQVAVTFLDTGRADVNMSNIHVNYEKGIDEAVKYLTRLGHKRIAFISGPLHLRSAARRLAAMKHALRQHLLHTRARIAYGNFQIDGGAAAAHEILNVKNPPTAILAANDLMAMGVLRACQERNLNVPRDVSVIGFDDIAFAALTMPPLTTISLPRAELGARAIETIARVIEHPNSKGVEARVSTKLVIRQSCAKAVS